ncbi:MAG: FecR family protein, partial [Gammaproteobacteria bacterium]|nr:FecR family protein [Gammaproteobacteria bacterium]
MFKKTTILFALITVSLMLSTSSFAKTRAEAGKVVFALGQVVAKSPDGKKRNLNRKSIVYSEDLIVTNSKSQLQIRFADNGFVSIRPNSEFRIDEFAYSNSKGTDKNHFELVKGGFRAITGQIGRVNKAAFKVKTPVGTLGIRGTDFTAMFCRGDCGAGVRQESGAEDGLYVGVVSGGVEVVNKAGSLLINPNQYGFVNGLSGVPKSIPKPPSFLMFDRTKRTAKNVLAKLGRKGGGKQNKNNGENKGDKQKLAANGSKQGNGKTGGQGNATDSSGGVPAALSEVAGEVIETASLSAPELADSGGSFSLLSSVIGERFGIEGNSLLPASSSKLGATAIDSGDAAIGAATDVINSTNIAEDIYTGGLLSGVGGGDGGTSDGSSPGTTGPEIQPVVLDTHKAFAMTTSPIQSLVGSTTVNHLDAVVTDVNNNELNAFLDNTANDSYLFDNPKYSFFGDILDKGLDEQTGLSWGRWASGDVAYGTEANPQSTLL